MVRLYNYSLLSYYGNMLCLVISRTQQTYLRLSRFSIVSHRCLSRKSDQVKGSKSILRKRFVSIRENIVTIPNIITTIRICASPVIGYLVIQSEFRTALGCLIVIGASDLLDGWIARTFPLQSSVLGSIIDPLADKILIGCVVLALCHVNLIPVPLVAVIILRDLLLMGYSAVVRYRSLIPPKTFKRYWNPKLVSARVEPTLISKLNTGVQLSLIAACLAAPVLGFMDHPYLIALQYFTAFSTCLSGASYVFTKRTFTVIRKREKQL